MSAQLQGDGVAHSNMFSARLALSAGVSVSIHAPSLVDLQLVVGKLQPTEPIVSGNAQPALTPKVTATAPAGSSASPTTAASAQPAAAPAAGEQGNGAAASPSPAPAAVSTASSSAPSGSPAVSFDELKKAFLALSTKAGGREKCEGVLAPFKLAKLSAATPEQYGAVLAAIEKASA